MFTFVKYHMINICSQYDHCILITWLQHTTYKWRQSVCLTNLCSLLQLSFQSQCHNTLTIHTWWCSGIIRWICLPLPTFINLHGHMLHLLYTWWNMGYDCTHSWTINEPHLPYKTGLDVMQSHPLHRTLFGQYQASSAALGWPGA